MSKVVFLLFLLPITLIFFSLFAKPVYALPSCSAQTDPTPLLNSQNKAKFTVNVGDNKNYDSYIMEFKCGVGNEKKDAAKEGDTNITVELDKSGGTGPVGIGLGTSPCEFNEGTHEILVKAVVNNQEVDQCTTTYTVINSNTQCKLSINSDKGITSATKLAVSGENLTKDGKFVVFFDDDAIDIVNNPTGRAQLSFPGAGNVDTQNFGPKPIPQELMTPGTHIISLRQRNLDQDYYNPIKGEKDFYGSPLCPLSFTVGTPDRPGGVNPSGTIPSKACTVEDIKAGKCTSGGGTPCGTDNPGISTAIGCIHTEPIALIKDFLKFLTAISGGLAFLMMLLGAFQMITSAGNPETLQAGRDRFQSAIIGLLFVIFAILLLKIIGVDILGLGTQFGIK